MSRAGRTQAGMERADWRAQHVPSSREYKAAHNAAATPAKTVRLDGLGVEIRGGQVYRTGLGSRRLGPLAGAHAEVTDPQRRRHVAAAAVTLMPVIALAKRDKAVAFVAFADGTVHERKLDGNGPVRRAQRDALTFNALAAS